MASAGLKQLAESAKSAPSLLRRLRDALVAPWSITGPASSPEFRMSLVPATEYRTHAPGSPPVQLIIPRSRPELTYDIKYYTRERRRVFDPAINLGKVRTVDVAVTGLAPLQGQPPAPGVRSRLQAWGTPGGARAVPLLDNEKDGYT